MTLAARIALTATQPGVQAPAAMQPYACRLVVNVFKHPPMVQSAATLPNKRKQLYEADTTNKQPMQETIKNTNMQNHNTVKKTLGDGR